MDHPPPKESRAPINLRIKFRSESLDQFIDRYSIDVSRGGIFIRTREPLAVGTQLKFDFQLQDASPLMAGEGTVVWIREYDANRTGITPGMGVRFDKLTATSQPILEKILAEKGRREQGNQSGGIMSKVGAGMAVRRPSSTFTALDPRALGLVAGTPGAGGEAPAAGATTPDSVTRRERRPSAPTLPPTAPANASPSTMSSAERTHQGFASTTAAPTASSTSTTSSPVNNPERTHMGGFAAPGSPGYPPPMTLPSASPQRPRTPGPLPALETPGSGRHNTGSVSRLNAARPASYEPPTSADIDKALDGLTGGHEARPAAPPAAARPSSRAAADSHGVPGLNEDEAPSEPTKTGDALSEMVAAATQTSADERAAAAAAGVVDGAAPSAEIDSDRTLATSAAQIAEMLEESARTATTPEKTAKDMPALSEAAAAAIMAETGAGITPAPPAPAAEAAPATGPSLVLIKNDKHDAAAKGHDASKGEQSPSAIAGADGAATAEAAAAAVSANSAQSPTAAGSFTAGKLSGVAANTVGAAADTTRPAGAAAKTGSARPAKRRSAAPFVVAGLIGAAAIIAVAVSQQKAPDHSQESFQARKAEPATAENPTPPAPPTAGEQPAAPAAAATSPTPGTTTATAPSPAPTPANEPPKPVEAAKATEPAASASVPAPEATPPAPSAAPSPGGNAGVKAAAPTAARAEKSKGAGSRAAGERKPTVAVVGPPKKATASTTASATASAASAATASAADSAPADEASDAKKTEGSASASAQRPAVQHLLKITSSPPGADVLIDGQSVGKTPYQAREIDAEAPHAVTIRLDGYEPHEHMISASDWLKQKANLETAKVNVKLRKLAAGSATDPTAARSDSARAEPPKAEAATKVEAAPAEKTPEATPAPAATEPPKAKDEPATAPAK